MTKHTFKGFTLIEIIVVIAIIGVLASILIPSMMGYIKKSRKTADRSTAGSLGRVAMAAIGDENEDYSSMGTNCDVSVHRGADGDENYTLTVLGINVGDDWKAIGGSDELIDQFNSDADNTPVRYHGGSLPSECWIVGYSNGASQQLEVWVGSKNGTPSYRLWPNPDREYV